MIDRTRSSGHSPVLPDQDDSAVMSGPFRDGVTADRGANARRYRGCHWRGGYMLTPLRHPVRTREATLMVISVLGDPVVPRPRPQGSPVAAHQVPKVDAPVVGDPVGFGDAESLHERQCGVIGDGK